MDSSAFRSSFLFEALTVPLCTLVVAISAWSALAGHHEDAAASAARSDAAAASAGAMGSDAAAAEVPAAEAAESMASTAPAAAREGTGRVSRASFTAQVVDREPVGEIVSLTEETEEVLFFSELIGLEGRTVTHRWQLDGEVMAEVPFAVGGPRWRVHSSKRLLPGWAGEWTVAVVDDSGAVLTRKSFTYAPEPRVAVREPAAAASEPEPVATPEPTPLPASAPE